MSVANISAQSLKWPRPKFLPLDLDYGLTHLRRRTDTAGCVDVEPKLDIARYHMIEPQINLMNFSAVTILLARVVVVAQ